MRISVAMCTYNGERYVQEQLASIAAQSVVPDELVVCDDRSQDRTRELVEKFARSAPFAVQLTVNEKNLGSTQNFERAIGLCQGDLIALSDQDDIWNPNKLATMHTAFEADPALSGFFSDGSFVDESSNPLEGSLWRSVRFPAGAISNPEKFARALLKADLVTGATMMLRSSCRDFLLPIPSPWVHDGWLAWMCVLHGKIAATSDRLIQYRIHRGQQLGFTTAGVTGRTSAQRDEPHHLRHVVEEFEVLRQHYEQAADLRFPWLADGLRAKVLHFRKRSELPTGRLRRFASVLAQVPSYVKYSSGRGTLVRDLLWP